MIGELTLAIVMAVAPTDSVARAGARATLAPQDAGSGRSVAFTGHFAFRWTRMYEDGSRFVGGGLGVLLGERTRLELVGYGTAKPSRYSTLDFRLAYGGVQADHELKRRGWLVFGTAATVAAGSFAVKDRRADTEERTGVWVAEPDLYVGAHLGSHLRVTAGASYRWVWGIEGDILNRSDGDARGGAISLRLAVR